MPHSGHDFDGLDDGKRGRKQTWFSHKILSCGLLAAALGTSVMILIYIFFEDQDEPRLRERKTKLEGQLLLGALCRYQ